MELHKEEAIRAKENAEKRFAAKDFVGAKSFALQAQTLNPELEGISQMVATMDVYIASEGKASGKIDCYSVLGLKPPANKAAVKKQYMKLAVLLHPDKNKSVGADGAFRIVSEAWTLLSDSFKKTDRKLSSPVVQTNSSSVQTSGAVVSNARCQPHMSHGNPHTFWTVCTSCKVQYEYLRKYLNKKLRCKNCRGVFIAVETGSAPTTGAFPYSSWPSFHDNIFGSHAHNGVAFLPSNAVIFTGNGPSGFPAGHGSDYVPNLSFQWSSFPGASAGIVDPNKLHAKSGNVISYPSHDNDYRSREKVKSGVNGKHHMQSAVVNGGLNVLDGCHQTSGSRSKPSKKQKVDIDGTARNGHEELTCKTTSEVTALNGNGSAAIALNPKVPHPCEAAIKRYSSVPAFDARKLLIDKARSEIQKKLKEMRLASAVGEKKKDDVITLRKGLTRADMGVSGQHLELKNTCPSSINVPDPDFHDFDRDRAEDCFKPKQIWALYDEEDGMPRLYCLIRHIISVRPFKIHISYLNSKTDSEFGLVNWVDCGFTKSCGNFRAWNSDVIDHVNIFSHLLNGKKAARGGCVQIYPKSGDIWAVYRNWSTSWNRATPDEVRHQYEMVEVLDNYSEELGVCVTPLIKLDGFKTVYQRKTDKDAIQWIPRREMLRFSHQVPSWSLRGEATNLPEGCWDLDPAAIPEELLRVVTVTEVKTEA